MRGYRDNELAQALRRASKYQEEAEDAREEAEKTKRELARLQAEKRKKPPFWKRISISWPSLPRPRWHPLKSVTSLMLTLVVLAVGVATWLLVDHYVFDIRDGYVVGHNYSPAHTTTQCITSNGTTTCTPVFHPEVWSIRIAYNGEDAWWSVSEARYHQAQNGSWFCVDTDKQCREPASP